MTRKATTVLMAIAIACWTTGCKRQANIPGPHYESRAVPADPALQKLIKDLDSPSAETRKRAALTLDEHPDKAQPAVPALLSALKGKGGKTGSSTGSCWLALVHIANAQSGPCLELADIPVVASALRDENLEVRMAALGLLDSLAYVTLNLKLDSRYSEALISVMPELISVLEDPDMWVRGGAVGTLKWLGPNAAPAISSLIRVMQRDREPHVRALAAQALGAIRSDSDQVVSAIVDALGDEVMEVRIEAVRALEAIVPGQEYAIKALTKASQGKDDFAGAASGALREIRHRKWVQDHPEKTGSQ